VDHRHARGGNDGGSKTATLVKCAANLIDLRLITTPIQRDYATSNVI
jgi:hypothetical protein